MMSMIICITGMPGSGKSTVANILHEHGFVVEEMRDEFMHQMRLQGRFPEGKEIWKLAADFKAEHGMDAIAKAMVKRIDQDSNTVIAGLRNSAELEVFRNTFGDGLVVVEVVALPETRYARLSGRGVSIDPKSYKEFLEREQNDLVGLGQASMKGMSDIRMTNSGSIEELRSNVEAFLKDAQGRVARAKTKS